MKISANHLTFKTFSTMLEVVTLTTKTYPLLFPVFSQNTYF